MRHSQCQAQECVCVTFFGSSSLTRMTGCAEVDASDIRYGGGGGGGGLLRE